MMSGNSHNRFDKENILDATNAPQAVNGLHAHRNIGNRLQIQAPAP